jgi:hypothetical protein
VSCELQHHGVKGQRWGVRKYQYADGTLTPAGKKRYAVKKNTSGVKRASNLASMRVKEFVNVTRTTITGKQYVDGYIKSETTLARIQTAKNFENFAFYATYKRHDTEEYLGLFGKNLISRAHGDAARAEKQANASGSEADLATAKELRDRADNIKVYQLKLSATRKLKIPSDENASDIVAKLLKETEFKENVVASIQDSKEKMKRPTQQILFNQAQKALKKDPSRMTYSEKVAVYKAFNLSLVNHNKQEIAAQDRFYGELKKKGYNALLDYNDKEFSSYHAKRPMIVFDVESVKLQSVTEANPKVVDKLYKKYNTERIMKEIPTETIGLVGRYGAKTLSECYSYIDSKMNDYLSG